MRPNASLPQVSRETIGGGLRISLVELPPELSARVALEVETWKARGWWVDGALLLTPEAWLELGAPPEPHRSGDDHEVRADEWASRQELLMDLLGIEKQVMRVALVGIMGQDRARLSVQVDGEPAPPERRDPWGFVSLAGGARHPVAPFVAWALAELATFDGGARRSQLACWGHVRAGLEFASARLAARFELKVTGFLERVRPIVPERFALSWVPSGPEGRFRSLETHYIDRDGRRQLLPYDNFDPAGIVEVGPGQAVLLPPPVAQVVEVARRHDRKLPRDVEAALSDPAVLVPEGVPADEWFDLSEYSERVAGFERIRAQRGADTREASGIAWFEPAPHRDGAFVELVLGGAGDRAAGRLTLKSREKAAELLAVIQRSLKQGGAPVSFEGATIEPTPDLALQLTNALAIAPPEEVPSTTGPGTATGSRAPTPGRLAAIVRELESADASPDLAPSAEEAVVPWNVLASLLAPGVMLKPHQRRGVAWLCQHAKSGSSGVLLADDMGLGKTLQVACFLALKRVERPRSRQLIVCPTVLLENWREELERFFTREAWGSTFVLHGAGLSRLVRQGALSTDYLGDQELVLTNYETLGAHQKSLLRLSFDEVVFDEAHNVKNPDTLRSRAARALKRGFSVAMTGTPVENELLDVWAVFDAAQVRQPRAFGTRAEFTRDFASLGQDAVPRLRQRLRYPSFGSPLLRREKSEALKDLPPKEYVARKVEMTAAQAEQEHLIAENAPRRGALAALADLQKLYQHPALLSSQRRTLSSATVLEVSPKTRLCLDILSDIQRTRSGEKALVFVISRAMQEVLAILFRERLGLSRVHIINGEPENRASALTHIRDFSSHPGFDVLVLSPLAAGAGLNIVAANHVIHYARWWNPAKEDQATDRAYRIGQTRPVTVYYPVLHRPGAPEEGFDLRLHELVERKRKVARDFLAPGQEATREQAEFLNVLQREASV